MSEIQARAARASNSAQWAAWADALGFISELTDAPGLSRRTAGRPLRDTLEWKRRIGGRNGVTVSLPAGCYSDDTQLRLAVSRSIGPDGFDVEAFSKVELPVWTCYALGGGIGTKASARNLSRSSVAWYSNFHKGWTEGGGNGAAMRIHPHVWAASDPCTPRSFLPEVIADAVVTHGHPRALVGAVLNALAAALSQGFGRTPDVSDWAHLMRATREAAVLFEENIQIASYWIPRWELERKQSFTRAYEEAASECEDLLEKGKQFLGHIRSRKGEAQVAVSEAYERYCNDAGLSDRATRGSGSHTVVAAIVLAAAFPDDPRSAAIVAANNVSTDTDTIATMAAAIIGANVTDAPSGVVLDREYIISEAERMTAIALGAQATTFAYPDLLYWSPPQTQIDVVGYADRQVAVAGLGWLRPAKWSSEKISGGNAVWQWMTSDFGQSMLVKRRDELEEISMRNKPVRRSSLVAADPSVTLGQAESVKSPISPPERKPNESRPDESSPKVTYPRTVGPADVDEILRWVQNRDFSDGALGYALRRLAELGSVEQTVAFTVSVRSRIREAKNKERSG